VKRLKRRSEDEKDRGAASTLTEGATSERIPAAETAAAADGSRGDAASAASTSLIRYPRSAAVINQRGRGVILVVDADAAQAESTADVLDSVGFQCHIAPGSAAAQETLLRNHYDLVLTDFRLPKTDGLDFIKKVREISPFVSIMILTADASVENAVQCIKQGVFDYLVRPVPDAKLIERIIAAVEGQRFLHAQEAERDRRQIISQSPLTFEGIVFDSEEMRRVLEQCAQVAKTDATVLITGESGTGKDLIARAIHKNSLRRSQRFLSVNCAALSPQIIESELFGHERGSFTGANVQRIGYFEHCDKGTIFLDEVGDIPLETQVKLLRVLEQKVITRVGSNDPRPVDVRVISATHRDLEKFVQEGKFREDLYYRIKVITIHLPPLRERTQDIPPLISYFFRHYSEAYGKSFAGIEPDALSALVAHPWKGNVRELKHTIENLIVVARGPKITLQDLPRHIRQSRQLASPTNGGVQTLVGMKMRDVERELIKHTLAQVDGNRQRAAKLLGIGERTLYRKIHRYALGGEAGEPDSGHEDGR
jgi:two-component system response regulator HydG